MELGFIWHIVILLFILKLQPKRVNRTTIAVWPVVLSWGLPSSYDFGSIELVPLAAPTTATQTPPQLSVHYRAVHPDDIEPRLWHWATGRNRTSMVQIFVVIRESPQLVARHLLRYQ